MTKVLVSIPVSPAHKYIHRDVFNAALQIKKDGRYKTDIITPDKNPFENNLHHIRNYFIKGDWDYWLTIDADNPPIGNPLDLIELNLDVVGLPTPVWCNKKVGDRPFYLNAYMYVEDKDAYTEWPNKEGLQEVDAIGTGCVIFARRVFENKELQKGCFNRKYNEDGTVDRGNDIAFCERAKKQGFKIYAHFNYMCYHFVQLEIGEAAKAFYNVYNK